MTVLTTNVLSLRNQRTRRTQAAFPLAPPPPPPTVAPLVDGTEPAVPFNVTFSGNAVHPVRDVAAYPGTPDRVTTPEQLPVAAIRFVDHRGLPVNASAGLPSSAFVGNIAPGTPQNGMLWWNADRGEMFVYYNDGNSSQWVPATPSNVGSVSVFAFGAKGDGVTDDTAAIQAAIDHVYANGGGVVYFPSGTYKVSASALGETYDNMGVVTLSSDCAIVQRSGVSLIGQADCSARITTTDRTLIIIAQVAPLNCSIEGFDISSNYTVGLSGAGMGIMTLGTAGGANRTCRGNVYRNLTIHNVSSYGIGLQNGSPIRCRIEDVDVYYTGADGIDLKARGEIGASTSPYPALPVNEPTGNTVTNCTIRHHGNRVTGSAGIDMRGIWQLSGITVTEFGGDPTLEYDGIRFRTYPDPAVNTFQDWPESARYSTLVDFYIKATPGAAALITNGVQIGSQDVRIANGIADGCTNNVAFIGNTTASGDDCSIVNVTSLNALTYGCLISANINRASIIGFTSKNSATAGIRNIGNYTYIAGAASNADALSIDTSATVLPTQTLLNGAGNSSLQLGSYAPQVRLTLGGQVTGNSTSYGMFVNPVVMSDVTATGYGISTSLATAPASFSTTLRHFAAVQGAIGAGSTVTTQAGFVAHQTLVGATANYGFQGIIPTAAGNWNVYASGTAQNWFNGNVGIGAGRSVPANALDVAGNGVFSAALSANATVAVGAGANTQAFIKASSTANLGIYFGNTVPAFTAAKGSLYTNTAATTTTTRLYVNIDGAATWASLTTSA